MKNTSFSYSDNPKEARQNFISHLHNITETDLVPLNESYGRTSASDLYSKYNLPSCTRSAMDGYAVHSEDLLSTSSFSPVVMPVTRELFAEDVCHTVISHGEAVKIMTGAMLPPGCDAVVRQEDTDSGNHSVKIFKSVLPFENCCKVGENVREGQRLLFRGQRIGRHEIGICASCGIDRLLVTRTVSVAVITTGSELQKPGTILSPGKIYESISPMLTVAMKTEGVDVYNFGPYVDDTELLVRSLITASKKFDFIITTGGVSVGKKDLIPDALKAAGATILFQRTKLQPGTPTTGSILNEKGILSLSGNPYAALANFDYYFWSALASLTASNSCIPEEKVALLLEDCPVKSNMLRLVRACEKNGEVTFPALSHKASVYHNLSSCNCYVFVPPGEKLLKGNKAMIQMMKGI